MSNKTLQRLIISVWFILHLFLALKLHPFVSYLWQLDRISSITSLSHFVDLNMMTRFLASMIDKKPLLTGFIDSLKPIEFFTLILDLALIFALIENKRIIYLAKVQLGLNFLYQALIYALFMFLMGITDTHIALSLIKGIAVIIGLWILTQISIPIVSFYQLRSHERSR